MHLLRFLRFLPFFALLFPLGIVATEGGTVTDPPETADNDDPAKEEKPAAKAPNRIARALAVAGGKDDPLVAANALLTTRCESAEQAATAARLKITDLETLLTAAAAENTKLETQLATVTTKLGLKGEITPAALDLAIGAAVAADIAKTGTPRSTLPSASKGDGPPTLSLEAFNKLSTKDKEKFMSTGGKLTD